MFKFLKNNLFSKYVWFCVVSNGAPGGRQKKWLSEAGITGGYETLNLGAGNQTLVL